MCEYHWFWVSLVYFLRFSGWIWFVVLSHDIAVQYAGITARFNSCLSYYTVCMDHLSQRKSYYVMIKIHLLVHYRKNYSTGLIYFFFLASRWITHDLWSSVSSLFRVSRLDMDYCCMLKKTYLWSRFLISNKTFQIFFILNTCSMTVIENHWKIIIEKLVIIWD